MKREDFRLNHGVYFGIMAMAFGTWVMAAVTTQPPYTRWFFLFIMVIYVTEYVNLFWRKLISKNPKKYIYQFGKKTVRDEVLYPAIKFIQRFLLILTIFLMSNGDIVDLSVGSFLAIVLLVARPQINSKEHPFKQRTEDWLERIDEVILGYLIVFMFHAIPQYGLEIFTIPRLTMLLGFMIHYALVVYRETRQLDKNGDLVKYNALGLAGWWAIIPIINAIVR
jgi:hypothetical protein